MPAESPVCRWEFIGETAMRRWLFLRRLVNAGREHAAEEGGRRRCSELNGVGRRNVLYSVPLHCFSLSFLVFEASFPHVFRGKHAPQIGSPESTWQPIQFVHTLLGIGGVE